jgi:predicted GIY-YIG superfamily endonuclease
MSIIVGKYSFEGPYTHTDILADRSGIYAIHCHRDNTYYLIDVGESAQVKTRVDNHDRKECWSRNCSRTLTVSVLYTPNAQQPERLQIEQELRDQYNPPCGKR